MTPQQIYFKKQLHLVLYEVCEQSQPYLKALRKMVKCIDLIIKCYVSVYDFSG